MDAKTASWLHGFEFFPVELSQLLNLCLAVSDFLGRVRRAVSKVVLKAFLRQLFPFKKLHRRLGLRGRLFVYSKAVSKKKLAVRAVSYFRGSYFPTRISKESNRGSLLGLFLGVLIFPPIFQRRSDFASAARSQQYQAATRERARDWPSTGEAF